MKRLIACLILMTVAALGQTAAVHFSGTHLSLPVAETVLFTPTSSALQLWQVNLVLTETVPGVGCTGRLQATLRWTDGRGENVLSPTTPPGWGFGFPWSQTVATSTTGMGTSGEARVTIMQTSNTPPTFSIATPSGCIGMEYEYAIVAFRLL